MPFIPLVSCRGPIKIKAVKKQPILSAPSDLDFQKFYDVSITSSWASEIEKKVAGLDFLGADNKYSFVDGQVNKLIFFSTIPKQNPIIS